MPDELRVAIRNVVIVPGDSPANQDVKGSYEKGAAGLYGGIVAGGRRSTVSKDVGGVTVNVPIPILQLPGMVVGGIAGATQKQIQDFRDALADDLINASSQPMTNDKIALDVYSEIRKLPALGANLFAPTTPIPAGTDAILFVSLQELTIEVDGNDAILTANAKATVHRPSDEADVYAREFLYQDRDTLSNWTDNDNALWRDYINFARHYLGREIAAAVFHTVKLGHTLEPVKTDTVSMQRKNPWQASSKKRRPTLGWSLQLIPGEGDPAWAAGIAETDIFYDLEIYDLHRPVYTRYQVQGSRHTVTEDLDACKTYRWSVRPSYHLAGDIKHGEWMRIAAGGNIGRQASAAPAYLQDFASLEVRCGSK